MRISDWSSDVCSSDLCPTTTIGGRDAACQHNIEYRAADATANPYVAIAALIRAGLGGLADALPPPAIVAEHPNTLDEARRSSEERRVGKGWVRTGGSRGWPSH